MASVVETVRGLVAQVREQPLTALTALVVTFIAICLTTRFTTGQNHGIQSKSQLLDAKTPPAIPYWIPYLGHLPQMLFKSDSFLAGLRKLHPGGAFSLTFFGRTHTIVFKPALTAALADQPPQVIDGGPASRHLMQSVFGYPRSKSSMALYDKVVPDIKGLDTHLSSEPSLGQMVERTATTLRHNIADFVTFNSGDIDQTPWERLAEAGLVEDAGADTPVVEADMFELVRNFVAFTANGSLFGSDFVENYPEFWRAFWRFDAGFTTLAMDYPSLLPLSKAIGARRARSVLFRCLDEYENALETHRNGGNPGPKWADLDNVGPVVQGRLDDVYRKQALSIQQRSAFDLALAWAVNTNANPLIFWMLCRIYADPDLLARIRAEIAPFVVPEKIAVEFGGIFETPRRIEKVDVDGLVNQCPYLNASYIESSRLDASTWSFRSVREDTVVGDKSGPEDAQKVLLRAGTYALGAYELHHTDPSAYEDPLTWRAERHIRWKVNNKGGKEAVADAGSTRPFGKFHPVESGLVGCARGLTGVLGDGALMCDGTRFASREVLLFSAAILAVYDIEPINGGEWKLPKQKRTAGTRHPAWSTRVWIKSRPAESEDS